MSWLKKQLGPFPAGVWLLIIAAGIAVAIVINRQLGAGGEEPEVVLTPDTGPDPYAGGTGPAAPGYLGPIGLPGPPSSSSSPTTDGPLITDNDTWISVAVEKLKADPTTGATPLAILDALQTYIAGGQLTPAQRAIVNRAILLIGPPPYGAPVQQPTAPAPATPVTVTPQMDRYESIVYAAYQDILGRAPDASGLRYWANLLRTGVIDDARLRQELRRSKEAGKLYA